ncbi:hypothetical protein [Alkalicoccus luteus]|uniref:hypothetical protein n=1 Tax=Alkalicoccus luteus TaxID=1237094 RepID=UPI00143A687D|nr:hypothetical protein [Alkalicoccus luteus]
MGTNRRGEGVYEVGTPLYEEGIVVYEEVLAFYEEVDGVYEKPGTAPGRVGPLSAATESIDCRSAIRK